MKYLATIRGASLVELVTVMVVLGIVATMAAAMFGNTLQSYLLGSEAADNASQAQLALERITRDMKSIRSASSSDLTPSASQISFVDFSSGDIIGYHLSGSGLYRTVTPTGTPIVLASNIGALSFEYLTADGRVALTSPASAVSLIYYIHARISVVSENLSLGFGTTVKPAAF